MIRELLKLAKEHGFDLNMECGDLTILERLATMPERTPSQRHFGLWHDADNMRDAMRSTCKGAARNRMFAFDFEGR